MKTHHYVVYGYEDEDGKILWMLDYGTTDARFDEGCIYDIDDDEWILHPSIEDNERDERLTADLTKRLNMRFVEHKGGVFTEEE